MVGICGIGRLGVVAILLFKVYIASPNLYGYPSCNHRSIEMCQVWPFDKLTSHTVYCVHCLALASTTAHDEGKILHCGEGWEEIVFIPPHCGLVENCVEQDCGQFRPSFGTPPTLCLMIYEGN